MPHDHARSRAYRWGEDGLAGFSRRRAAAVPGAGPVERADPILKERIFGLTGQRGQPREDAKEYWWYLDALPSHAWKRWRYHYPQRAFPYGDLVAENGGAASSIPSTSCSTPACSTTTGTGSSRSTTPRPTRTTCCMPVTVTNAGPEPATDARPADRLVPQHVVLGRRPRRGPAARGRRRAGVTEHAFLGPLELAGGAGPDGPPARALLRERDEPQPPVRRERRRRIPKDGINDHVVAGADTVRADGGGTKAAFWYRLTVEPGETVALPRPAAPAGPAERDRWGDFDLVIAARARRPTSSTPSSPRPPSRDDEANVLRQAFAGMIWGKQFYDYDIARGSTGDPASRRPRPRAAPAATRAGATSSLRHHVDARHVGVPVVRGVGPAVPRRRARPRRPGVRQVPADPDLPRVVPASQRRAAGLRVVVRDVNPPVQAWAALEVYAIDGARDPEFLEQVFQKLLLNFTWWVNRKDPDGNNLFQGGFLGLDNIGPSTARTCPRGEPRAVGRYGLDGRLCALDARYRGWSSTRAARSATTWRPSSSSTSAYLGRAQ